MNLEELQEELDGILIAGYEVSTDSKGQVVIYTNLKEDDDGELVEMDDLDDDLDDELEDLDDEELDEIEDDEDD